MNEFENIISQSERTIYSLAVSLDRPASSIVKRSSDYRYNLQSFKYTRCERKYMSSSTEVSWDIVEIDRIWQGLLVYNFSLNPIKFHSQYICLILHQKYYGEGWTFSCQISIDDLWHNIETRMTYPCNAMFKGLLVQCFYNWYIT